MEFESPDVERDFPGLYASESGKRSNESDFSDDAHVSKKDLLIGKRKDKKDSKKDRGYATLEGESTPEEESDVKSPSKVKKSKPFKFSSKKEKREKSREKDHKDKDSDKDKKKSDDKEKDKRKDVKIKLKLKEKKKCKSEDSCNGVEELPVFGVPLSEAVERSKCHDGVNIPLVVRNCIDHIQQHGLTVENIYKISGIKSRVHQARRMYNQREPVIISDFDLPVATSLLKLFFRELPEPVLTKEFSGKFEEAVALKDTDSRLLQLKVLISQLPSCNRCLLGWMLKHMSDISMHERQNKMSVQTISAALSPCLQISHKLLVILLNNVSSLFPDLILTRYVPPLTCGSPSLPETSEGIMVELKKQESLLSHIHREVSLGIVNKKKEEQLWEVQRIITQLKRKLRVFEKGQRSLDETDLPPRPTEEVPVQVSVPINKGPMSVPQELNFDLNVPNNQEKTASHHHVKLASVTPESLEVEDINKETTEQMEKEKRAVFETEELVTAMKKLMKQCDNEKFELHRLKTKLNELMGAPISRACVSDSSDDDLPPSRLDGVDGELSVKRKVLREETKRLKKEQDQLMENIIREFDECIDLKVKIKLLKLHNQLDV